MSGLQQPGLLEDTDEIATDAPSKFRQPAEVVIVVDVGGRAEDDPAQVSYMYEIENREPLSRGLHEKVDVTVLASLVACHGAIQEQPSNAEVMQLLTAAA